MSNINYNKDIVASLAFSDNDDTFNILNYIFKEAPVKIKNEAIYQYSKRFNASLVALLDEDSKNKYIFILHIIDENRLNKKIVSEAIITNKAYKVIFADLFINEDTWYINIFNIDKNHYEIINQKDITKITILKYELQIVNIDYKLVDKQILEFVNKPDTQEISIKLSPELLNSIVNLDLLDDYEVFEEIKTYSKNINNANSNRDNYMHLGSVSMDNIFGNSQIKYKKIVLADIPDNARSNIIYSQCVNTNNIKKRIYKVDIKTSTSKFDILMKLFSSKFEIVSDEYKSKCYCCNK